MNLVKTGTKFRIFDSSVEAVTNLAPGAYEVGSAQFEGIFLRSCEMPVLRDEKVYGDHERKLDKVFGTYSKHKDRNLGVILSGDKGIGKTLFAKMASHRAAKLGLPVVYVNDYFDGLAGFMAKITQDCMVVFDEFDKNFCSNSREAVDVTACQDALLSMFDGVYAGHKLFVITCNDLGKVSDFLVNRPGRFRYHIRFDYPSGDEVVQYLKDKLGAKANDTQIEAVRKFTSLVPLTYDCLSAVADELADGETFKSAMSMLNIVRLDEDSDYSVYFNFKVNGEAHTCLLDSHETFDLFSPDGDWQERQYNVHAYGPNREDIRKFYFGSVAFDQADLRKFCEVSRDGRLYLAPKYFKYRKAKFDADEKKRVSEEIVEYVKAVEPVSVELAPTSYSNRNISYSHVL